MPNTPPKKNIPTLRTAESEGERRTTWAELLNDLAYTAIIAQIANRLGTSLTGEALLECLLLYVPVWWLWNGQTHYATRFDNPDDIGHRLLGSAQLIGLFILAASISKATEGRSVVYALAYASVRAVLLVEYGRAWVYVPEARPYIRVILIGFTLSVGLWIGSVWLEPPYRYAVWAVALLIELATPLTAGGNLFAQLPPDVRHLPERYGLFTLLVLGQAVTGVVAGLMNSTFHPNMIGAAILGGVIIIGLWWAYFDRLDDDAVRQLAEQKEGTPENESSVQKPAVRQYAIWLYMHLPLTVALTGYGVALTRTVQAVDAPILPTPIYYLLTGATATYLLAEAAISFTTLRSGPAHVSFQRGVWARTGAGVAVLVVGLLTHLSALWLLFVLSALVTALIVSDQLAPDAPDSTERVGEGVE